MRFLHLADLHIGKLLHTHSLLPDQKDILQQIVRIAKEQAPDAVLIAGDIYQRSAPSPEAMTLFSGFLADLVGLGLPVYLISGNHDSAERISYLSELAANSGVYIAGAGASAVTEFTAQDAFGTVHIHLMPYCTPLSIRRKYPDEAAQIRTYEDALRTVMAHHPITAPEDRHVLVCHQYLTGAEVCGSEELAIGGMDNVPVSLFDGYDYVALGHLHGPQRVSRDTVRYAGSPLRYSFAELNQKKSVTVVDLLEKGNVQITTVPLTPLHGMQEITSEFQSLIQQAETDDHVHITLTDECPPPDAARRLRSVYHNLLLLSIANGKQRSDRAALFEDTLPAQGDFMSLLRQFYADQNQGVPMSDDVQEIARKLLEETESGVTAL